ncbi:MAG TPA: VTT domain-containing protein [Caulobacteraceae bacterium]|nr:VTT domain-containing protein [Caulobacteraceae bacterium]
MGRISQFVTNMDAKAWRSLVVSFVLFGGVGLVFVLGAPELGLTGKAGVEHWLALAKGPWALPVAVAAFAVLAFLGAPQVVLIAAAAVVFGPWTGSLYSWIGTFVSALIGLELGRLFGGRLIRDLNSRGVDRFIALVGRNGFMASLIIRLVPAAPFIVVNMAAGAARVRRRDFALGTAIGIVPKILLTAFTGGAVTAAFSGGGVIEIALLALAVLLWVGSAWLARRWLRAREAAALAERAQEPASAE